MPANAGIKRVDVEERRSFFPGLPRTVTLSELLFRRGPSPRPAAPTRPAGGPDLRRGRGRRPPVVHRPPCRRARRPPFPPARLHGRGEKRTRAASGRTIRG